MIGANLRPVDRVLLLTGTTSYRTDDFLAAARRLGVDVLVGSNRCKALAALWSEAEAERPELPPVSVDFLKPERAVSRLVDAARETPFGGIVPVGEPEAVVASLVGTALGLPAVPPAAAAAARNKRVMREALAARGVLQPAFRVFPVRAGAERIAGEIELPVVVKPLLLSGSRGVVRADSVPALRAALVRVRALLESPELFKLRGPDARRVLVEQFVPGAEVAVEGLVQDGVLEVLAIFDKPDPLDGPFFEETIYVTPSRHPVAVQAAIRRVTAQAVEALGVRTGPVHAEMRLGASGDTPVVIEVALRTIGGLCSRALRFGMGLSLEELVIANALGRRPPSLERERRAAGVMMLPIPKAGTLRAVRGLDEARAVPGIEDVVITIRKGRVLVPLPEGNGYLGFAFARGETPAAVERALRAAHACLSFDIARTVVAGAVRP